MLKPRSHAHVSNAARASFTPAGAGVSRRSCACNESLTGKCDECGKKGLSLQRSPEGSEFGIRSSANPLIEPRALGASGRPSNVMTSAFNEPRAGHDFSNLRILSRALAPTDQTPGESGEPGQESMKDSAPAAENPAPDNAEATAAPMGVTPVIDSVEMVTSSSGAVGGYREHEVMCDASLNNPGPFNDFWAKGSIANVFQVHFHVSQGSPTDVRAARVVNGTATAATGGGKSWTKAGDDSPPLWEYQFTKDKMVIADAPGWCNEMLETDFPITYSRDFGLWAYDPLTKNILASIAYHVEISKTHYGQIDAVNTITVTDKKVGGAVASPYKPKPKGT